MSLTNYAELKVELESWSHRDDITGRLDTFIDLTEAKLWQELRIRGMETRDATLTSTDRIITLPTGFIAPRSLRYVDAIRYPTMEYVTPDNLEIDTASGIPTQFTFYGSEIELNRNGSGTYTLIYYQSLTGLSAANTTNAVIDDYPNLYLYGGLAEVFAWAQDTEEETKWRGKFMMEIKDANQKAKAGRYGPSPAANKRGSTP